MTKLTFDRFQTFNKERCLDKFHSAEDWWPIENWALAIAGEAGELCNLVKKIIRGDFALDEAAVREAVLSEIADVITYCDLAMTTLSASTAEEVVKKFNIVSDRVGSAVKL